MSFRVKLRVKSLNPYVNQYWGDAGQQALNPNYRTISAFGLNSQQFNINYASLINGQRNTCFTNNPDLLKVN